MSDIVEKIKKLLRLSENNPNLNEAILAGAKAQELAQKYNIALEILRERGGYFDDKIIDYIRNHGEPFWKDNPEKWEMILASVVAQFNGCRVFTISKLITPSQNFENVINIVGRKNDTEITKSIISWLHIQINVLTVKDGHNKNDEWKTSYRYGAVVKIQEKFEKTNSSVNEEFKEKIPGSDSAIAKLDNRLTEVDKFISQMNLSEGSSEQLANDVGAFAKGYNAANSIELNENKKIQDEKLKRMTK